MSRPEQFTAELGPGGLEARGYVSEVRAEGDAAAPRITGYASVYNQATTIDGWFMSWDEEVAAGAWATALKPDADVRSMFNHNTDRLLGRTTAGTLTLEDQTYGLHYDVAINPDDPNAMSVHAQVARGDVTGSSVWFYVTSERWDEPTEDNGLERSKRTILSGELFEGGPVVFPAFPQTTSEAVAMRGLGYNRDQVVAVEGAVRAAGATKALTVARHTAGILLDPSQAETQLRDLIARRPALRDAVCAAGAAAAEDLERVNRNRHAHALAILARRTP